MSEGTPRGEYMVPQTGIGQLDVEPEVYALMIRMFADNFSVKAAVDEAARRFGDGAVTRHQGQRIKLTRREEILRLREHLNTTLVEDDRLWIVNKHKRVAMLQRIVEDANRWVPARILRPPTGRDAGRLVIVYEKDTGTMMAALRQAREELGDTAEGKAAESLADLVKLAEQTRGLSSTIDVTPDDAVPILQDTLMEDAPELMPSSGDDDSRGFLDGGQPMAGLAPGEVREALLGIPRADGDDDSSSGEPDPI